MNVFLEEGGKHCGKRKVCLLTTQKSMLPVFSSFLTLILGSIFCGGCEKSGLVNVVGQLFLFRVSEIFIT